MSTTTTTTETIPPPCCPHKVSEHEPKGRNVSVAPVGAPCTIPGCRCLGLLPRSTRRGKPRAGGKRP